MSKNKGNKKPEAAAKKTTPNKPAAVEAPAAAVEAPVTPAPETAPAAPAPAANEATCKTCGRTAPKKEFIIASNGAICKDHDTCIAYKKAHPEATGKSLADKAAAAIANAAAKPAKKKGEPKKSGPTCRDRVREFIKDRTEFTVTEIAELLQTNMNNASTTVNLLITRPGNNHLPIPFKMDKAKGKGVYVSTVVTPEQAAVDAEIKEKGHLGEAPAA